MSKNGAGFVTIAQNTKDVDYLTLAYAQALNIKSLHKNASYAVIVDSATLVQVTDKQRTVFDHIIELPHDNATCSEWKLANEYQVFELSPFKETIKIEADLLFTRSIDHWWPAFSMRDVFFSSGIKNYRQQQSTCKTYRKFFEDNELPDIYNGLMYFRYSKFASNFFATASEIFHNWEHLKNYAFKNCREDTPSTDVLYAVTAKVMGVENCTIPTMDFINFVHMKNAVNGWGNTDRDWRNIVMCEMDGQMLRINNLNQYQPVHYHNKQFMTNELIEHYERL